jgi:hypothetical protein
LDRRARNRKKIPSFQGLTAALEKKRDVWFIHSGHDSVMKLPAPQGSAREV